MEETTGLEMQPQPLLLVFKDLACEILFELNLHAILVSEDQLEHSEDQAHDVHPSAEGAEANNAAALGSDNPEPLDNPLEPLDRQGVKELVDAFPQPRARDEVTCWVLIVKFLLDLLFCVHY